MEKDCYQEIVDEVRKKIADKITSEENDLTHRATLIDRDIADIVQDIGLKTRLKPSELGYKQDEGRQSLLQNSGRRLSGCL